MPGCLRGKQCFQCTERLIPSIEFHILEGYENDRIFPLIVAVFLSIRPNLLIRKIFLCILVCLFKKRADHIHIQCFSETERTLKK